MITILYPYRNRDLERVKRSLDSLALQTDHRFKVLFVDYGSSPQQASQMEQLINSYSFAYYIYTYTCMQPWSRAKALNVGLQQLATDFVFTADIDMIFSPHLVSILHEVKHPQKAVYFKVGFLSREESFSEKPFDQYIISFTSDVGAQGLSLFAVEALKAINGYDEFLHFWGAEDIDIHNRLEQLGLSSFFYETAILMLHQWHPTYRNSEIKSLTTDLQLSSIVALNHKHLQYNDILFKTTIKQKDWGIQVDKNAFKTMESEPVAFTILNTSVAVTHFLFVQLPKFRGGVLKVRFEEDPFATTMKYHIKRILGKKVPQYYTLKEINDQVLLHIISFYHQYPYMYQVSSDLKSITFAIKK
ncbi:hypothetical protein BXU11_05125 [Flavobacterium sp. LM5]|uniref:glycosyltransferase family 2 protein n=1 Tax=Flavobacterium sp. LM5 TaxID=1938610 RepID=UPI0009927F87|nr:glycosyltransferase family 2 protein [Flavobacterium sp. LM5]OOV29302.1 hypothetical protein BXU11_05125 [Flavobacterium sp. LM5]